MGSLRVRTMWFVLLGFGLMLGGLKCDSSPTEGIFRVKVRAVDMRGDGAAKVAVFLNGKISGYTDDMGTFTGQIRGKVGARVKVEVRKDPENFAKGFGRLRAKKVNGEWRTLDVRVMLTLGGVGQSLAKKTAPKHRVRVRSRRRVRRIRHRRRLVAAARRGMAGSSASQGGKPERLDRAVPPVRRGDSDGTTGTGQPERRLPPVERRVVPSKAQKVVVKPGCLRPFRRKEQRWVVLVASSGTSFYLKGEHCDEKLMKIRAGQEVHLQLPVGTFQRIRAVSRSGGRREKVFQVKVGEGPMKIRFRTGVSGCDISSIQHDIQRRKPISAQALGCLQKVPYGQPNHLSAHLGASRYLCQKRKYANGLAILKKLLRYPKYKFRPYPAMNLGIHLGRCKDYNRAIQMLKRAERASNQFVGRDRYQNTKALYEAMAQLYEQRFYRSKDTLDLTRAVKSQQRHLDFLRASDSRAKRKAKKELARLKKLAKVRGGLENE